jgi:uncharacterized membrane protein
MRAMEYFRPRTSSPALYMTLLAVMTALTTIATIIIAIPFPTTSGYLNFGDTMVMLSGLILGPLGGFMAGGFGSALGDITLGYFHFAPITLIVKGCEGMCVGIICHRVRFQSRLSRWDILGFLVASIVMLTGYFLGELPLYGLVPALEELLFTNSIQVIAGSVVTAIAGPAVRGFISKYLWEPRMDETHQESSVVLSPS